MRSIKALTAILLAFIFALPVTASTVNTDKSEVSEIINYSDNTEKTEPTENTTEGTFDTTPVSAVPKLNGFVKHKGKTRYYINGKMQKGFVRIKRHYCYFDRHGYMAKGFRKIGRHRFYFARNGHMITGFRKIGRYRYHFGVNGWMSKGFKKIGKHKYCFNSKGHMLTGSRKIGKSRYYFLRNGRMKKGFLYKKGKIFYYSKATGKMLKGFYQIGKHTYHFDKKTGAAYKGFSTVTRKGKTYRVYFDKKGRLKKGRFTVGKVEFKAEKKYGRIYSCRNLAKALCQFPEMPSGCEVVSWTMMANYAGVKIDKIKVAKIMPKSKNPNKGFMGSPYMATGDGLVVFPNGLQNMTQKHLHGYKNLTGCKLSTIKQQLESHKLVMAWVQGLIVSWSHTVALTGYDNKGFYYNDPFTGQKNKVDYKTFMKVWKANGTMAMTY
ncbi:MAG: C39 family peptidase [Ruminococcus sp.]|nr:C39 family peptidase [Ruminococcus sp.]